MQSSIKSKEFVPDLSAAFSAKEFAHNDPIFKGMFEDALGRLRQAVENKTTRPVTVKVFAQEFIVPIREGGGHRPLPERELIDILARHHFSICAYLPSSGLFANLGVKWNFGVPRGGYEAEVVVAPNVQDSLGTVVATALYSKVHKGRRLEMNELHEQKWSSELSLGEVIDELKIHPDYCLRSKPLVINHEGGSYGVLRPSIAPNFIDTLIANYLDSCDEVSFVTRIPPRGDIWVYGKNWPVADPLNGKLTELSFVKEEGGETQRSMRVFAENIAATPDPLSPFLPFTPKVLLFFSSEARTWSNTELSLEEALTELKKVDGYNQRRSVVGIQLDEKILFARPTNDGAGWTLADMAFQFALTSSGEITFILDGSDTSKISMFGFDIPTISLPNLPASITYNCENTPPQPTTMSLYESLAYTDSGVELGRKVLEVNLIKNSTSTNLTLEEFLPYLDRLAVTSEIRASIKIQKQIFPIRWTTKGSEWHTKALIPLLQTSPNFELTISPPPSGHVYFLGLEVYLSDKLEPGTVARIRFRSGKPVEGFLEGAVTKELKLRAAS